MQIWTLGHSLEGWSIRLEESPAWAIFVSASYEKLLDVLGHPCCHFHVCDHSHPCEFGEHPEHKHTIWGRLAHFVPKWPKWTRFKGDQDCEYETNLQDFVEVLQWKLADNWFAMLQYTKSKTVLTVPITRDQAHLISPKFVEDLERIFDDDDEEDDVGVLEEH